MIGFALIATMTLAGGPIGGDELREMVPGVRVAEGVVEFDGTVCADLRFEETDRVFLELMVTGPDSREHESLVVTSVKGSAIHAGMLAAGFEAGSPIAWEGGVVSREASGDAVRVLVRADGGDDFEELASWVVHIDGEQRLENADGWLGYVFTGSEVVEEGPRAGYAADKTGTIVGLAGFGTEVIGAAWSLSPEASVAEPVWIVDERRVPDFGTEVLVRIERLPAAEESDGTP